MTRLRHELKPYIASLRLSKVEIILFVEGTDFDPLFYGKILARFRSESAVSTELRRAADLPNDAGSGMAGSGGKNKLLQAAHLWESYKGKHPGKWRNKKALVFCVDKDVEDFTGLPEFVPSVIRTPHHSVENHLFCSAELSDTVEAALSLAPGDLGPLRLSGDDWRKRAASLWFEWITFCLLCSRLQAFEVRTYSVPSVFNRPPHQSTDISVAEEYFDRLQVSSGLTQTSFADMRRQTESLVTEIFAVGQYDRIFKGKWYFDVLCSQLRVSQWSSEAAHVGRRGLLAAIRANFKLTETDYIYYREILEQLLAEFRDLGTPMPPQQLKSSPSSPPSTNA